MDRERIIRKNRTHFGEVSAPAGTAGQRLTKYPGGV